MQENKLSRTAIALTLAGVMGTLAMPGSSMAAERTNVRVTALRVYPGGNIHVDFSTALNATCGARLRVGGAGASHIVRTALSALMSNKAVDVGSTNALNGSFCDLTYLRVYDQ